MSSRVGLEEPGSPPWISTPRPHASSNDTVFQVDTEVIVVSSSVNKLSNFQSSSQGAENRSRRRGEGRGRSAEEGAMSRGRSAEDGSSLRGGGHVGALGLEEKGLVRGRSAEEGGVLDLLRSDIRTPRRPLEGTAIC